MNFNDEIGFEFVSIQKQKANGSKYVIEMNSTQMKRHYEINKYIMI